MALFLVLSAFALALTVLAFVNGSNKSTVLKQADAGAGHNLLARRALDAEAVVWNMDMGAATTQRVNLSDDSAQYGLSVRLSKQTSIFCYGNYSQSWPRMAHVACNVVQLSGANISTGAPLVVDVRSLLDVTAVALSEESAILCFWSTFDKSFGATCTTLTVFGLNSTLVKGADLTVSMYRASMVTVTRLSNTAGIVCVQGPDSYDEPLGDCSCAAFLLTGTTLTKGIDVIVNPQLRAGHLSHAIRASETIGMVCFDGSASSSRATDYGAACVALNVSGSTLAKGRELSLKNKHVGFMQITRFSDLVYVACSAGVCFTLQLAGISLVAGTAVVMLNVPQYAVITVALVPFTDAAGIVCHSGSGETGAQGACSAVSVEGDVLKKGEDLVLHTDNTWDIEVRRISETVGIACYTVGFPMHPNVGRVCNVLNLAAPNLTHGQDLTSHEAMSQFPTLASPRISCSEGYGGHPVSCASKPLFRFQTDVVFRIYNDPI